MISLRTSPLAWAMGALACAVVFLGPPGVDRRYLFWGLMAAFAASSTLSLSPWGRVSACGRALASSLGPACLVLAFAGLCALVADRAAHVLACGLGSAFISEIMEGREIVKAWLLSQGQSIYTDLTDYPLFVTLYGPLYYGLAAASAELFGPGVFSARLVSVVSGVALSAVAAGVVLRLSGSLAAALACALLTLVTPTMAYAAHARPDVLVWLTLFAGLSCLLGAARTPRRMGPSFWGTVAFLTLAAFSKQQTWVFIAAALGYCLWDKGLRPLGLRLGAALAGTCAAALVCLNAATNGEYVRQTILFPKRMSGLGSFNSFASTLDRFREFLQAHWGLSAVFAASLVLKRRRIGLLEAMFLLGLCSMVMVMRWWGSSVNHFLSLALFMLIESGTLLARFFREGRHGWAALALAVIAPPVFAVSVPSGSDPCGAQPERQALAALEARLQTLTGPVVMDAEGAYVFLGNPLFSRLMLYDAWETDFFDKVGLWSLPDSVLARDIRQRRAAAFVDSRVFMSEDLAWLVRAYYRQDFTAGRYSVHTPRREAAILRFDGLGSASGASSGSAAGSGADSCADGGCLELVSAESLKEWGNYLQPTGDSGSLVLKATGLPQGPGGGTAVALAYHPRFTGPGQMVSVLVSPDAKSWTKAGSASWQGPPPGTGFENRHEATAVSSGQALFIRFEMTGSAQLWVTPRRPVLAYVGPADLTARKE